MRISANGVKMKKTVLIVLCIAVLAAAFCAFIACEKEDEEVTIASFAIEDKTYAIGDKYAQDDAKITATLTDKTTVDVTKNLVFAGDDDATLNLEDGKFTKAGEYKVKVYKFEKREDLLIGEWTIKVA